MPDGEFTPTSTPVILEQIPDGDIAAPTSSSTDMELLPVGEFTPTSMPVISVPTPDGVGSEPIPDDAVFIKIDDSDLGGMGTGYQFDPEKSFSVLAFDLPPGAYTVSDASYKINSGDILMAGGTWSPMGLNTQIGFVDKYDSSIQYWTSIQSGGSFYSNKTESIDTTNMPTGEYYVCIGAAHSNANVVNKDYAYIELVIGVFQWNNNNEAEISKESKADVQKGNLIYRLHSESTIEN